MFGVRYGPRWSVDNITNIAVGQYGLEVRYTTKISNGFRGVYSSSIGPYVRNNKSIPYNTSSWFIWQDLAGVVRFQQVSDYPPSPTAESPSGLGWLMEKSLTSIGLAFDQKNSRVVCWSYGDRCGVSYFDENTTLQLQEWNGYDAVVFFDGIFLGELNSDVIVFYLDKTRRKLMYRLQTDRYTIEYLYYEFRTSFFLQIPIYTLDHIEITQHTFVLYLTDNSGREVQLESYSYGFKHYDFAKTFTSVVGGSYRFLAIADTTNQPERLLMAYGMARGDLVASILKQDIEETAFVTAQLAYGNFIAQVYDTSLEDAFSSTVTLGGGNSYSISERTSASAESVSASTRLSGGLASMQKIQSVADRSIVTYAVSSGKSNQIRFKPDDVLEAVTSSIQFKHGDAMYFERKLIELSDDTINAVSIESGAYLIKVYVTEVNDTAQSVYSVNRGDHTLTIKTAVAQESTRATYTITQGAMTASKIIEGSDESFNNLSIGYGAYTETIKKTRTQQDDANVSYIIRRGSSRQLNQLGDQINESPYNFMNMPHGSYDLATIKQASATDPVALSYGLGGGSLDFMGSEFTFDYAMNWFMMPDVFGIGTQGNSDTIGEPVTRFFNDQVYPVYVEGMGIRSIVKSDSAYIYYTLDDLLLVGPIEGYNALNEAAYVWFKE